MVLMGGGRPREKSLDPVSDLVGGDCKGEGGECKGGGESVRGEGGLEQAKGPSPGVIMEEMEAFGSAIFR